MKIERDKVYLTRCGEKVRVVCVDAPHPEPVVAIHSDGAYTHLPSGAFYSDGEDSYLDIVSEYVEPPKPREVWVYPYGPNSYGSAMSDAERTGYLSEDPEYAAKLVKFREVIA